MNKFDLQSHYQKLQGLQDNRKFYGALRLRALYQKAILNGSSVSLGEGYKNFVEYVQATMNSSVPLPGQSVQDYRAIHTAFDPIIRLETHSVVSRVDGGAIKVQYKLVDADDYTLVTSTDGIVASSVVALDGVLTINVPEYLAASERRGSVTLTLTKTDATPVSETIEVIQRGF